MCTWELVSIDVSVSLLLSHQVMDVEENIFTWNQVGLGTFNWLFNRHRYFQRAPGIPLTAIEYHLLDVRCWVYVGE